MVKCLFCGTIYVDEYANKEEEILIVQAYEKIRSFKFEQATDEFDKILEIYPKSHEAYYGRLQARNKVIYFNSKEGTKRYPSFFGKEIPNYFEDEDFVKAVEFAPKEIAESYNEQAQRVEKIRENFINEAQNHHYDVVLNAHKEKTENFEKIFSGLTARNLEVFLRFEIKKQKKDVEAFTFQAVNTAKVEILLLENADFLNNPRVRNLYQRFLYRIEVKDRFPSSFIVVYDSKNVSIEVIKKTFPNLQKLYDINDGNYLEDLLTYVKSATERDYNKKVGLEKRVLKEEKPQKKEKVDIVTIAPAELGHYNVENIPLSEKNKVKWIFYSIKNGDFETAEKLIQEEKEENPSGEIYFASLLCSKKIRTEEEFFSNIDNFSDREELEKVLKYSSSTFANNFVNNWEKLIVKENDVENYLKYLEFLAQYQNSMHNEFLDEAEKLAVETLNEKLIDKILKCLPADNVDKYTSFYFQLAQKTGDEEYYKKILELDEGHPQALFALFMKNFDTVEEKLSYRNRDDLENVLKYCDKERRSGFLTDLINLVSEISFYDIKKAEEQFDFFLSYIDDEECLQKTLISLASFLQAKGFFKLSEKYLTLAIKNDKENAELYWQLIEVKTHCHNESELLTTSVKISEMEDWKTLLNYANDEQAEKYSQVVAKANISSAKKVFRMETFDKLVLKEKLRDFLIRNDKILKDAQDKTLANYYKEQFKAFESYFEKIENANTFEEYYDIFTRLFDRLDMMDLTIDTSVNIAKVGTKKTSLEVLEKEAKRRDDKYLSTVEEERRWRRRKIVLFCCLLLAPMLLVTLFLIMVVSAPKEMYMVFSQDGVIIFTILSVIVGLGTLIYNSIKVAGEKKWRLARFAITIIGFANLICLLCGFYIYPPEISILNADEFNKIIHNASYVDVVLENDIDLSKFEWTAVDFYGNIDGNNKKLFNINFKNGEKSLALFDEFGGNVENLTIEILEKEYVGVEEFGAFAITNNGKIENCTANLSIAIDSESLVFGGLSAYQGAGEISKSKATVEINLKSNGNLVFGGIVGESRSKNEMSENMAYVSVNILANKSKINFGGLVGENSTLISLSKAEVTLNLTGEENEVLVGGLCGRTYRSINDSYVTGSFDFNETKGVTAGGLVGEMAKRQQTIEHSYQNISFESATGRMGALVGYLKEGIVKNSFSVASINKIWGGKGLNEGIAPEPSNCKNFEKVEDVTNEFGFSKEIWNFENGLPTLKCFMEESF